MPRIARCTRDDPHRVFCINWLQYLIQFCLCEKCCGVPFGKVRHHFFNTRRQLSVMASIKGHLDWERYNLPAPYDSDLGAAETCLMVLSLFAAFPELTSIPAFNRGGKGWTGINHALSEIGVGIFLPRRRRQYLLLVLGWSDHAARTSSASKSLLELS